MSDEPFEEYKQKKKQHAQSQQPMSQEQRTKQELQKLPQGKELMNWICQHVANRIGDPVLWQYAGQSAQKVEFMNGKTNNRLLIAEIDRQEIAQTRAMGQSWIDQFMAAIENAKGQGGGPASKMHEKFEDDVSERFGDMMDKIKGEDN